MSNLNKKNHPDYILNPSSGKYVKKSGIVGRRVLKEIAEKSLDGDEVCSNELKPGNVQVNIRLIGVDGQVKSETSFIEKESSMKEVHTNRINLHQLSHTLDRLDSMVHKKKALDQNRRMRDEPDENSVEGNFPINSSEIEHHSSVNVEARHFPKDIELEKKDDLMKKKTDEVERHPKRLLHFNQTRQIEDLEKAEKTLHEITIYTDGAVSNNHDITRSYGGIGVYFGKNDKRNISERFTEGKVTNQRAELFAIIRACESVLKNKERTARPVRIYTDSMYALNILNGKWKAKDNLDLVRRGKEVLSKMPGVKLNHIRGHTGKNDPHSIGNSMADRLAVQGKNKRLSEV